MRIIELCAGYGGIGLGLQIAMPQARVVGVVERQAYCAALHVARVEAENMVPRAPIWPDVESFAAVVAPRLPAGFADIICAGIPCQPWSVAGKRTGMQDQRWIWSPIRRIIGVMRPRFIFVENVPGLRRQGGLAAILRDLARLGYDAEWDCFSAAEVGANHLRERIWILAYAARHDAGGSRAGSGNVADSQHAERWSYDSSRGPIQRPNSDAQRQESATRPQSDGETTGDATDSASSRRNGREERGKYFERRAYETSRSGDMGKWSANAEQRGAISDSTGERLEEWYGLHAGREAYAATEALGWWDVEPEICRMVDGRSVRMERLTLGEPDRSEQLHALGNGVVPLQAAFAFVTLAGRAGLGVLPDYNSAKGGAK